MRYIFKILFLCSLVLMACSSEEDPALSAVGEIKFSPEIVAVDQGGGLQLRFASSEIFPCINYPLQVSETFSEGTLTVKFLGIGEVGGCYTALGPAKTYVDLREQTELLKLVQEGDTDLYEVSITEESVELKRLEASFTILEQQRLLLQKE